METQQLVITRGVNPQMLLFAIIILSSFLLLVLLVSKYRIYRKSGKAGISAFIPIWSEITLFSIVDKPWWYIFLYCVPIVNIVIIFYANILLAKKFGKGISIGIGMSLLPMIFIPLLSFYDYVGNKDEEEEPIYNPFNQTDVSQVMPITPSSVEPTVVDVNPVNNEEPSNIIENTLNENIPSFQNDFVSSGTVIGEEPVIKDKVETPNEIENNDINISVIPEVPTVSTIEQPSVNEMKIEEPLTIENDQVVSTINAQENISIQDIESALNINKPIETTDIAFNSKPVFLENVSENLEILNEVEEEKVTESVDVQNETEVIEMPEIAAKVCPACGTSLAGDIKFCTSCGTQL